MKRTIGDKNKTIMIKKYSKLNSSKERRSRMKRKGSSSEISLSSNKTLGHSFESVSKTESKKKQQLRLRETGLSTLKRVMNKTEF